MAVIGEIRRDFFGMKNLTKRRNECREIVRAQVAPVGEVFCAGYLSSKGEKANPGYESWLLTEVPSLSTEGWVRLVLRVDKAGTSKFEFGWNGERLSRNSYTEKLGDYSPRLLKSLPHIIQNRAEVAQ
jgi:hypothetical protein